VCVCVCGGVLSVSSTCIVNTFYNQSRQEQGTVNLHLSHGSQCAARNKCKIIISYHCIRIIEPKRRDITSLLYYLQIPHRSL